MGVVDITVDTIMDIAEEVMEEDIVEDMVDSDLVDDQEEVEVTMIFAELSALLIIQVQEELQHHFVQIHNLINLV